MTYPLVEINQYDFEKKIFEDFSGNHYAKNYWPLVYILSDGDTKLAYVGETTDVTHRMSTHLKTKSKQKLTSVHLITSEKFNKSATLDIESNLIKYMSGDNVFKLLNGNLGLANHNYYQKQEVYWDIFNSVWNKLRNKGITKHSIEHIDNSDLFKYSPYKSLTNEQNRSLYKILENLVNDKSNNILIEGGAGTGKTILAIFLFKMLSVYHEDFSYRQFGEEESEFIKLVKKLRKKLPDPKMALVVPMSSFRSTLQKVFKNIKGLSASMVIGPADVSKREYDLLVVDESHRLRRRVNLGTYFGAFDKACKRLNLNKNTSSELDWVLKQSKKTILFYDEGQSIKPSDVKKEDFSKLKKIKNTTVYKLKSQLRVKGGNDYVKFVGKLLNSEYNDVDIPFIFVDYEFLMFDDLSDMVKQIKLRNEESGLARLIAGYSWEWKSKNDKTQFDIEIDGVRLQWNQTTINFINSANSVNEVGCIHTTQGYDLNYSGVIFGNEISFDPIASRIIIKEENYFDRNGKQSINDPQELHDFIINIYKTIMLRGIKGTYVYVCDPKLRDYLKKLIPVFKNEKTSDIEISHYDDIDPFVNAVPLYDLKASAGSFSDEQKVEEYEWIKLSEDIRINKDMFACQIVGESMNKVIPNGSYCLFEKYSAGSRNGQIVLVEYTNLQDSDFGSCYTIKEYESHKVVNENGWEHKSIILKPVSYDRSYKNIEAEDEEILELKVKGIFKQVL